MVQIIQDFIPPGRRNRPGHAMTPRYLTCHDTANVQVGADAAAHARYLKNTPNLLAGWHYTVCSKAIYQHLPLNENGWHASDGTNGPGNRQSIGIEICENKDGNRMKAEANAAWLAAKLLKDFNLPVTAVKQHFDWSGKNCPRVLRGRKNGWQGFLDAVQSELNKAAASPLPKVDRIIALEVNGRRVTDEVGYIINNATHVRATYIVELAGGTITGHGDHVKIAVSSDSKQMDQLKAQIESLRREREQLSAELGIANGKIQDAIKVLNR